MLRPSSQLQAFLQSHKDVLFDLYTAYHLDGDTLPSHIPQHVVECRDDNGRVTWMTTNLSTRQQYTDKEWWKLDWMNRDTKPTRVITGFRSWVNHLFAEDKPTIGYPSQAQATVTRLLHLDLDGIKGQPRSIEFLDRLRTLGAYVCPGLKGYQAVFIFATPQTASVLRWIASEIGKQAAVEGWHLDKTNVGIFNGEVVEEVSSVALPILGPLHRRRYVFTEDTYTSDHNLTDEFIAHYSGPYHAEMSALTSAFRPTVTLKTFLLQPLDGDDADASPEGVPDSPTATASDLLTVTEVRQVLAGVLARLGGHSLRPLPVFIPHGEFHLHFRDFARMTPEYIAAASPAEKVEERLTQAARTHHQQDLYSIGKRNGRSASNPASQADRLLFDDEAIEAFISLGTDLHDPTSRIFGAALKQRRLATVIVAFLATLAHRKSNGCAPWVLTIKQAALIANWPLAEYASWKSGIAAFYKLIFKPTMAAITDRVEDEQHGSVWAFDAAYKAQRWGMATYVANALLRVYSGLLRPLRQPHQPRFVQTGVFVDIDGNNNGRNTGMMFRPFVACPLRC